MSRPRAKAFETIERSTNCCEPDEVSSWRPNGTLYCPALSMTDFLPLVKS
jgi:hypothetical protein